MRPNYRTQVTINVSREDSDLDIEEIGRQLAKMSEVVWPQLGATLTRTRGVWEGAVELGVQITMLFESGTHEQQQAKTDIVSDVLFALRTMLPTQKFFQVTETGVEMGEWDTRQRRYTNA